MHIFVHGFNDKGCKNRIISYFFFHIIDETQMSRQDGLPIRIRHLFNKSRFKAGTQASRQS